MNKEEAKSFLELGEEYDMLDDCLNHMIASMLRKRDRMFELSIQMKIMTEEDKQSN